jgi:hypothetical protein
MARASCGEEECELSVGGGGGGGGRSSSSRRRIRSRDVVVPRVWEAATRVRDWKETGEEEEVLISNHFGVVINVASREELIG